MKGIICDVNIEGQSQLLQSLLNSKEWHEIWSSLNLQVVSFDDLGLAHDAPDSLIWHTCQREAFALITDNRNDEGPDSLEATIRACNKPENLTVFTLANSQRFAAGGAYAHEVVESLLEYLLTIENCLGTGRLFLP